MMRLILEVREEQGIGLHAAGDAMTEKRFKLMQLWHIRGHVHCNMLLLHRYTEEDLDRRPRPSCIYGVFI